VKFTVPFRWLALFPAILFGWLAAPGAALAHKKVKVTVVTILASTKDKVVDKELKCIAKEVQKQKPELTGFQLKDTACESLRPGEKHSFKLVDGQKVVVVVERSPDKDKRVRLTVKAPLAKGEIEYITCCGKFLPIKTKYKTKKGELLLIAVMVRPCHKK
jgi:hypothetical protein